MMRLNRKGFTLVEIMIVVAIIGLLAAIAIPNFVRARATTQKNICINNLRMIESAKDQWAVEENKTSADTPVAANLDPYIKGTTSRLICPGGGTTFADSYDIKAIGTNVLCKKNGSDVGTEDHILP